MTETSLANVSLWRTELGLLPVPLFAEPSEPQSYVLLNGSRGNFCLDLQRSPTMEARSIAWSSDVGHYVSIAEDYVEVQRWDQSPSSLERYSSASVLKDLERFHAYLEQDAPSQGISIVSHGIRVYRRLRAVLGNQDGPNSLKIFLYLLACATDQVDRADLELQAWRLDTNAFEIATSIRNADWQALRKELVGGRPVDKLKPDLRLLLRHASGRLFQEAHFEAIVNPGRQLTLNGILPPLLSLSEASGGIGVHFTPPALARALVEEALTSVNRQSESITVFDPACGSGEFLRETLRQLRLTGYAGSIRLIGWDISEAACAMANFALAYEMRDFRTGVQVQIDCVDSLTPDLPWPTSVDLVVMNPPFALLPDLSATERRFVKDTLGSLARGKPNLSYAFIWRAVSSLGEDGVLGSVIPASFFDAHSAQELRKELAQRLTPKLLARLGSHLLFPKALIDAGLYVGKKGSDRSGSTVAFWSDHRPDSTSAGLRALRKARYYEGENVYPIVRGGFSVFLAPNLGHGSGSWAPRPYQSWKLVSGLSALPKAGQLFDIKQGARTGNVSAFLLDKDECSKLPDPEQKYFRPAVVNESIKKGLLSDAAYVFYPYGEYQLEDEEMLRAKLEVYYQRHLEPLKGQLKNRRGLSSAEKWWELTRHRAWQVERQPKIVSTYFGDAGSFAWDNTGNFVVVQGYAWLPRDSIASRVRQGNLVSSTVGLAYIAVLNSPLFSELLSATSNHVGGGQWDLSARFLNSIPIPDLSGAVDPPSIIFELASLGEQMQKGRALDEERLLDLVNLIYRVGIDY